MAKSDRLSYLVLMSSHLALKRKMHQSIYTFDGLAPADAGALQRSPDLD